MRRGSAAAMMRKEQAVIGQITSDGISERENSPQLPAQRQFQARMSLVEAREPTVAGPRLSAPLWPA